MLKILLLSAILIFSLFIIGKSYSSLQLVPIINPSNPDFQQLQPVFKNKQNALESNLIWSGLIGGITLILIVWCLINKKH